MVYTLTLNPALDYDLYLEELKKDELNLSKKVEFRVGGKGINVSLMLRNLGEKTKALGYISGFTGEYIKNQLDLLGIENDFIKTLGTSRINVKINDSYCETEISGLSPIINYDNVIKLKNYIKKLNEDDILVLAGSIPTGVEKNIYMELSKITKAKIFLDTRGNLLKDNVYKNIVIKPNIKELEEAFNVSIKNEKDIYNCAKYFLDLGVENVLVSMGENGAVLIKKDRYLKANIPSGKYINSVGAGDSMLAGFIYAYLNKFNDIETLRLCVACGSATAYSYGIGEIEMINKLKESINIEEIIL